MNFTQSNLAGTHSTNVFTNHVIGRNFLNEWKAICDE